MNRRWPVKLILFLPVFITTFTLVSYFRVRTDINHRYGKLALDHKIHPAFDRTHLFLWEVSYTIFLEEVSDKPMEMISKYDFLGRHIAPKASKRINIVIPLSPKR